MIDIPPPLQVAVFLIILGVTVSQWEGPTGTPQWFKDVQTKLSEGTSTTWQAARWGFSFMVAVAYVFFILSWGIYAVSPDSFHPRNSNPWNLYAIINGMFGAFLVLFKKYGWMMHAVEPAFEVRDSRDVKERSTGLTVLLAFHAFLIWGTSVSILALACYYFEASSKHNSFFIAAWVIIVVITTIGFIVSCFYAFRWKKMAGKARKGVNA